MFFSDEEAMRLIRIDSLANDSPRDKWQESGKEGILLFQVSQWAKSPKKQSVGAYFLVLYYECRINKNTLSQTVFFLTILPIRAVVQWYSIELSSHSPFFVTNGLCKSYKICLMSTDHG